MKKTLLSIGSLVFLFALFVSPALALEIEVDQFGNISIFEGYVLGEDTDDDVPSYTRDSVGTRRKPSRMINSREDRDLVVTMEDDGTAVELREAGDHMEGRNGSTSRRDRLKSDNLEVRFPAKTKSLSTEQRGEMSDYQEKIREKRQERVQEMVELRERNQEDGSALELKSRNVKAHLNGAEFVLDSESGEVILTTPSGNIHILTHLPDQALARMKEAGVISNETFDEDSQELEAVATEDGIEYTATVSERKKFLSFFPRTVEKRVTLDDATGEVSEESTSRAWFGRMMDRFSY